MSHLYKWHLLFLFLYLSEEGICVHWVTHKCEPKHILSIKSCIGKYNTMWYSSPNSWTYLFLFYRENLWNSSNGFNNQKPVHFIRLSVTFIKLLDVFVKHLHEELRYYTSMTVGSVFVCLFHRQHFTRTILNIHRYLMRENGWDFSIC